MPALPGVLVRCVTRGIDRPRTEFLSPLNRLPREKPAVSALDEELLQPTRLGWIEMNGPIVTLAHLGVHRQARRDRHYEFRSVVTPASAEVVLVRAVKIDAQHRMVGQRPFLAESRNHRAPTMTANDLRAVNEEMPHTGHPDGARRPDVGTNGDHAVH